MGNSIQVSAPGLVDKTSNNPLSQLLLGNVTAVQWIHHQLILYYTDHRKTRVYVDHNDNLCVQDYQVPTC